jgi:alkanesulfonate monooxygenase SsuD/methylene tetrahydromethanopterin reductase-like flavin-dependent oxidoreductase (luciferase family)
MVAEILAAMLGQSVEALHDLALLIGSAEQCAERVRAYAEAGAERIFVWPLADELRQLEAFLDRVVPLAATK